MSSQQFSIPYVRYIPAELQHHKNSNGWLIVYSAFNPATNDLELVRIRVNRLRKKCSNLKQFQIEAGQMVQDINSKLRGGWSPFTEGKVVARMYEPLTVAMEKYLVDRKRVLRGDSLRTYAGALSLLERWLDKNVYKCRCSDFTDIHAIEFMEDRLASGISSRTYNGYLKSYKAFFLWCKVHKYVSVNPFRDIEERKEEAKEREVISLSDLKKIRGYFEERCPGYVLVMLLMFFAGLRPKEITRIRVHQVNLRYKNIDMPGNTTKTGESRKAPISGEIIRFLSSYLVHTEPMDYLIGHEYVPGAEPCTVKSMERRWRKMRDKLNLPKEYQLYSLRDSVAYYRGESTEVAPLDAMKGMGHKKLSQTSIYANHEVRDLATRLERGTPTF